MKITFNPENELPRLAEHLRAFEASLVPFDHDSKYTNKLRLHRKEVEVINHFYRDYIIAITGGQGVGKSTIATEYLGLEGILPQGLGNDEKYPVYITETIDEGIDNKYCEGYTKVILDLNKNVGRINVTREEFMQDVCTPGDPSVVWFEIQIKTPPNKAVLGFRKLVVLPGYGGHKLDELTNQYINSALKYSSACIICFDAPTFATKSNMDFIENIVLPFFGNATPIYALTKSNPEHDSVGFRKNVKEKLSLSDKDDDRIIMTWSSVDGDTSRWKDALGRALDMHSIPPAGFRQQQLHNLRGTLEGLRSSLYQIDDEEIIQTLSLHYNLSDILKPFQDKKNKLMRKFRKNLKSAITITVGNERNFIDKEYSDLEFSDRFIEGVKHFFDRDRQLKKIGGRIRKELLSPLQVAVIDALEATVLDFPITDLEDIVEKPTNKNRLISTWYDSENSLENQLPQLDSENNAYNSLLTLFKNDKPNDEESTPIKKIDIRGGLEYLPILMFDWIRLTQVFQLVYPESKNASGVKNVKSMLNRVGDELNAEKAGLSKTLIAVASILGVDGAADGTINTIPNILNAMGVKVSSAVVGGLMWGVFGLFIADVAWKNVLLAERNRDLFINRVCDSIAESAYSDVDEKVTDFFEDVEELVEKQIRRALKLDQEINKRFHYMKCKAEVKKAVDRTIEYEVMEA